MSKPCNILIHRFDIDKPAYLDDEGDQMVGFYYQLTDLEDKPITTVIGPYSHNTDAERAALHAFRSKDF